MAQSTSYQVVDNLYWPSTYQVASKYKVEASITGKIKELHMFSKS